MMRLFIGHISKRNTNGGRDVTVKAMSTEQARHLIESCCINDIHTEFVSYVYPANMDMR